MERPETEERRRHEEGRRSDLRMVVEIDIVLEDEPDIFETIYRVEGWLEDPQNQVEARRHTFGYIKRGWHPNCWYDHDTLAYLDEALPRDPSYRGDEMPWEAKVWMNGELILVTDFPGYHHKGLKNGEQCVHAMFETRYGKSRCLWWPMIHRDDSKETA